jgi:uncharacterized protein (DUF952 family)
MPPVSAPTYDRAVEIYHLALPADWRAAIEAGGPYTVSTRGHSLADVGFIHCATADQVAGVAGRYYADVPGLLLLALDPDALGAEVRFEVPEGADEAFPHLYGPLPLRAVTSVRPYP